MQRRRVDVDGVAVIVIPARQAVQHDRRLRRLAVLAIERHQRGKLGQLDLPERERAVAQTLDGAAHDLVARPRSVDAPFAADEVEIHRQRALTHRHSPSRFPVTLPCFFRRTQSGQLPRGRKTQRAASSHTT